MKKLGASFDQEVKPLKSLDDVLKGKLLDTKPFAEDTLNKFNISQNNLEALYNYIIEQSENVKDITGFFN